MTLTEINAQINAAIVANGSGAITAEVLNPILLGMVEQINDLTGVLDDSAVEGDNIIAMINTLNEALGEIVSPTIYTGSGFPSILSVPSPSTGDYYLQTSGPTIENSYIYNGIGWVNLKNWINDAEVSEETTWSSQKIKEYLDAVDKLISIGTIAIEAGFAIIPAGAYWRIGGVIYSNAAEISVAIPAASPGMYRTDLLVANTSSGFDRVAGTESATYLSPPPPTAGTVAVAPITVYGGEISVTTPEVDTGLFVQKGFYNYKEFSGGGSAAVIPLDFKGRSDIRLVDDSLISVAGVDLSLITGVDFAEVPYKGKLYILRNLTANPISLLHGSGAAAVPFECFDNVDLEVPVKGAIIFSYYPDLCTVLFKSWDTAAASGQYIRQFIPLFDEYVAAINTWRGWARNESNILNGKANVSLGTGAVPSNLFDCNFFLVNGPNELLELLFVCNNSYSIKDYEIYIQSFTFVNATAIAAESDIQTLVHETITTAGSSLYTVVPLTVASNVLGAVTGIRVAWRHTGGSPYISEAPQLLYRFKN